MEKFPKKPEQALKTKKETEWQKTVILGSPDFERIIKSSEDLQRKLFGKAFDEPEFKKRRDEIIKHRVEQVGLDAKEVKEIMEAGGYEPR